MRPADRNIDRLSSLLKIISILLLCPLIWFCSGRLTTPQPAITPHPLNAQSQQQRSTTTSMGERLYLTNQQRGYKHKRCGMCNAVVERGILHGFIEQKTTRINPFTDQPFGRIEAICTTCHTGLHLAHPVGIIPNPQKVVLPPEASGFKGEEDRLTCMSCHDWHPTNKNYKYLRWPVAGEEDLNRFCLHCHTKQGIKDKSPMREANTQKAFKLMSSPNSYFKNPLAEKSEYFKGYRGAIFNLTSYTQKQTQKAKTDEIEIARATHRTIATLQVDRAENDQQRQKPINNRDKAKIQESAQGLTKDYTALMSEKVKRNYETGRTYKQAGELNNAIIYFRRAIELNPESSPIYCELGEIYLLKDWFDEAEAMFQKVIGLVPDFAPAYLGLSRVYKAKGEYSSAAEVCKTALRLKPGYGAAYYQLGLLYKQAGKLNEARQMLVKAINSSDAPYPAAYYELGLLYKQTNLAKAQEMFTQAIKQADHADACYELGLLYKQAGDPAGAAKMFSRAVTAKSNNPGAYYELAASYKQQGLIDKAITAYTQATKVDKRFAAAYYQLGVIFSENQQLPDADKMLSQAIKLNPDYYEAYYQLAKVYYQQKKLYRAIKLYEKVIAINHDYVEAYFELGKCYRQLGKTGKGITNLKRVIALYPEHAQAHYLLGDLYKTKGRAAKAEKEFQLAVKLSQSTADTLAESISPLNKEIVTNRIVTQLDPENVDAFFNLGTAYMAAGQLKDAVTAYRRVIDLKPQHWEAHYNIALAYKIQRKWPAATAALRNVIKIKPDLIDAHYALAEILQAQGQWEQAIQEFQQILSHKPATITYCIARIYYNQWLANQKEDNLLQAREYFSQAVKLNPKNIGAHNSLKQIEKLLTEESLPTSCPE